MKCVLNARSSALLALISLVVFAITSQAFTGTTRIDGFRRGYKTPLSRVGSIATSNDSSSTNLMARKDVSNAERGSDKVNNLMGLDRGKYLWVIVIALNIWFFSVPTEFRRTRICNEADSAAYPTRCMTSEQFTKGISDYYKNGGGIKFDFSIAGKE